MFMLEGSVVGFDGGRCGSCSSQKLFERALVVNGGRREKSCSIFVNAMTGVTGIGIVGCVVLH